MHDPDFDAQFRGQNRLGDQILAAAEDRRRARVLKSEWLVTKITGVVLFSGNPFIFSHEGQPVHPRHADVQEREAIGDFFELLEGRQRIGKTFGPEMRPDQ